jgi:hypothetical protein
MQVKFFWKNRPTGASIKGLGFKEAVKKTLAAATGENALEFEAEINAWLVDHRNVRIVDIKQSACGGDAAALWWISVWYEEGE